MSETIKKGDFVELEYTGKLEDGTVFDTTQESVAKKEGIHNANARYGPVIIQLGEKHIVAGLDKALEGKETGKNYKIEVPPEEGFGKKDAKLIQLISTSKFTKEGINPMRGLQVNIDGMLGVIKNISGGRTLVDFNHPLSGQKITYELKVLRAVADDNEKIKAMVELKMGLKDFGVEIKDGKAIVKTEKDMKIPDEVAKELSKDLSKGISSVKSIEFSAKETSKESKKQEDAKNEVKGLKTP